MVDLLQLPGVSRVEQILNDTKGQQSGPRFKCISVYGCPFIASGALPFCTLKAICKAMESLQKGYRVTLTPPTQSKENGNERVNWFSLKPPWPALRR